MLRSATATWALLKGAAIDPQHMVYVAGCQRATVVDHRVAVEEFEYRSPRKRLEFIATPEGDGTVTWASGRLAGVPMFYAPDTAHDELCSNAADRRIFRGYVELLTTGKTDQLSSAPPRRDARRGRRAGALRAAAVAGHRRHPGRACGAAAAASAATCRCCAGSMRRCRR